MKNLIYLIDLKDMRELKDKITSIILKKLIKEMIHPIIFKMEDFKTIGLVVHAVINKIKKEDFKIKGAKCKTKSMERSVFCRREHRSPRRGFHFAKMEWS